MSEKPAADDSGSDLKPTTESAFVKLFTAGVLGWLVGTVVLFGLSWVLSHPVSVPAAIVWTISHSWAGFLLGVLVLVAYGLIARLSVGRAVWAYILPVGLLAGIAGLCLLVYPDHALREDLLTYLPMVLMFYGMALLWLWLRRGGADASFFARAVIPAILGGLVILGFVTVPVFASDAFRYRNAFQLTISKTAVRDGKFMAEGTMEIRDPGRYEFIAPRYVWSGDVEEFEMESGAITWGVAGAPKSDAPGVYPMQIVWSRTLRQTASPESGFYDDAIRIEVHNVDEGGKVIYSLDAPIKNP
jgi:hypothetical protein